MNTSLYGTNFHSDLDTFRDQIDEIFRNFGVASNIRADVRGFPPINVGSTDDTFEIIAFLPGVEPNRLQATIDNGLLTISGERMSVSQQDKNDVHVYARERKTGPFRRVMELPEDADPDRVDARYVDGCLHISVHKRESSKPRSIQVHQ
ncbi:Hsp20/alpha crystallin family protein [Undibacterium sp.]|uniref:Hsp20/alpha crystallin family protein n=1 Tax=Undibacterium sp. TaxID=1914977 RepID=UPI002C3ADCD3|nr:Hsp20/alpha crystallin family protein [Undibacterium sp.]HTD05258.1 Hsp20/alpha crystallin family protein [Undibacterium sp.]